MDDMVQLGPLAMAADRAVAVLFIWAFVGMAALLSARTGANVSKAAWLAIAFGIAAARIAYILENLPSFMIEPWTMLALWQGGFSPWVGVPAAAMTIIAIIGRRRTTGVLVATLAALSLAYGTLAATLAPVPKPLPRGVVLTQIDGQQFRLDELRGRAFVLNLWATWCPPCRREMPMLIDVARSSTVPIVLVNQGEAAEQVRTFLNVNRMSDESVALDTSQQVAAATGAVAYPTTIFVNAEGKIVSVQAGEISRAALTAAIRDLEQATPQK